MLNFNLKKKAAAEIEGLPPAVRKRILEKLKFYSLQENPLKFAEKLQDNRFGEYRFRVGDYRAIFDVSGKVITILKVGHRKDVYKRRGKD